MPDEFGTLNVKRGDRSREIEVMRQQYRHHREALTRMAADAPTEHLATEYHRLIGDIDDAIRKLDELDGRVTREEERQTEPGTRPMMMPPAAATATRPGTDAGSRPLTPSPEGETEAEPWMVGPPDTRSRILLIMLAGAIVLVIIGWLIYRASRDRQRPDAIAESPAVTATVAPATAAPEPLAPPPDEVPPGALKVSPASADYGTIRKGTRAVRQFEVLNTTAAPMAIKVVRSSCKCLFYDYRENVPAKGKETVTVTIDGARAKAGTMNETVHVTAKKDPSIQTTFNVAAVIK
ncbi:MAG: DUF1573 domain-containing protein [Acidobacteriota bacterium]